MIASIDQVVVNGQHAEANVTTFMAYDPSLRSTRSLDLQYRDDQWKICQSPAVSRGAWASAERPASRTFGAECPPSRASGADRLA